MKIHVHKRNGKFLGTLTVAEDATLEEFKIEFDKQFHYYPERQRFTVKDPRGPVLKDGKLHDSGVEDNSVIYFKDLGVQMSWRLVFVLEYLGPLIIFPICYCLPQYIYGQNTSHNLTQRLALPLVMIHYLKREFESLFVHRFSNATMPFYRLPINCGHYWLLGGVFIAYFVCHPKYTAPWKSTWLPVVLAALMLVCETMNFRTHIILRNLRPRGSKARGIPRGSGFDQVSCANYMWESFAWISFAILVNTLTTWVFTAAAIGQMVSWAQKKHKRYLAMPDYPRNRAAIFPSVL